MTRTPRPRTHRFVVVYRAEAREIANAEEVRRGWVERVPDPRSAEAADAARDRQGFAALEDLPAVISGMIDRAEETEPKAPLGRRPSA